MEIDRLAALIEQPHIQKLLLGKYHGAYSLGVGRDPNNPRGLAVILDIETAGSPVVEPYLQLEGESVPVIVRTGFAPPKPLFPRNTNR
jgi:hypothetical protein